MLYVFICYMYNKGVQDFICFICKFICKNSKIQNLGRFGRKNSFWAEIRSLEQKISAKF